MGVGGFIGSHLLKPLLSCENYDITGIDISSNKIEKYLEHPLFAYENLDVHQSDKIDTHVKACDTVISLAALCNPAQYNTIPLKVIEINFISQYDLVKMCTNYKKRLIHFSTSEVYGKTIQGVAGRHIPDKTAVDTYLLSEKTSPLIMGPISAQRWSYATAKQLLERVIYAYGFEHNLEYCIVRPFNFIGSHMDYIPGIDGEGIPRVLACFMKALLFKEPIQLVNGGKNERVFTHIDDAIDAIMRIIERPKATRNCIFNIGNPTNEVSIEQLAQLMVEIYKELRPETRDDDFSIISVPADRFYGKGYEDSDKRIPDISAARDLLDWQPKIGIRDGLKKAMASFIEQYGKRHDV